MQLIEKELPVISPAQVLVKNLYTTICGSDLHTFCGLREEKTPTVLGHEIVGEIVEIGSAHSGMDYCGHPLRKGDIVTWSIFSSDPLSEQSLRGMPQKADDLFKYGHALVTEMDSFHGGLAEYCVLKENTTILKIPAGIPLNVAATINCAVATVAGSLRLAGDIKGKRVLITGLGLLGIVCAAMCKDAGAAEIYTADINTARLAVSLNFGADFTIILSSDGSLKKDKTSESLTGMDLVFDMSGAPEAMETGISALGVGGIAVWVGAVFKTRNISISAEQIVRNLITVKGLHNYNYTDFAYAVSFMEHNHMKFPFEDIIGKEFPLSEAQSAFEYAVEHKPLRVGIRIG